MARNIGQGGDGPRKLKTEETAAGGAAAKPESVAQPVEKAGADGKPKQQMPVQKAPEKKVVQQPMSAQKTSEKKAAEQKAPVQKVPLKKAPEQAGTPKKAPRAIEVEVPAAQGGAAAGSIPRAGKKPGKKMLIALIVILAAAAVLLAMYFLMWDGGVLAAADEEVTFVDTGVIYDGVTVMDVDLSGLTRQEAAPLIEQKSEEILDAISITYTVEEEEYVLDREDLGASMDVDKMLEEAAHYGRQGGFLDRKSAIDSAQESGAEIEAPIAYDKEKIESVVAGSRGSMNIEPEDAGVEMNPVSDEEKMITGMDIVFTDHKIGRKVDEEKLVEDIYAAAADGTYGIIEAGVEAVEPAVKREDLDELYTQRGVYETSYTSSSHGRRYNIWKMSDVINGVKIEPGETWSINEEAGPRTYALGWKGAPGISDGEYKEEAGGGICQVSSTLYNAVLRAEVEIAERTHHSWPLDYVPGGLDATISTGSPDFKITNNYDVPIYIIAECDGEDSKTVKISIYGPPYEDGLRRDFTSELISTGGSGEPIRIADPTLPMGQEVQVIGAHPAKTYNVYKHYYDADGNEVDANGNPTDEPELYMVDKYAAKPAKIRVGTANPWAVPAA